MTGGPPAVWPSGELSHRPEKVWTQVAASTSHARIEKSSEAEIARDPSSVTSTAVTVLACPMSTAEHSPARSSHTRTEQSQLPVRIRLVADIATVVIVVSCPLKELDALTSGHVPTP